MATLTGFELTVDLIASDMNMNKHKDTVRCLLAKKNSLLTIPDSGSSSRRGTMIEEDTDLAEAPPPLPPKKPPSSTLDKVLPGKLKCNANFMNKL